MFRDEEATRMAAHEGIVPGWFVDRVWVLGERMYRPIDVTDLADLMRWRNEQQAVLRQQEALTPEGQERWLKGVVEPSYHQTCPSALQVISLDGDTRVAYGGLTNIEWVSRRAELSFLVATEVAESQDRYEEEFRRFLDWTARFCFDELGFNRIFAETWDFRARHVAVLEEFGFALEGRMRSHVAKNERVYDALLHGLLADDWRSA